MIKRGIAIWLMCASVLFGQQFPEKWPQINNWMQMSVTNLVSGGLVTNAPALGYIQKGASNTWTIYFPVGGVVTQVITFIPPAKYLNVSGGLLTMSGDPTSGVNIIELTPATLTSAGFIGQYGTPQLYWDVGLGSTPIRLRKDAAGFSIRDSSDSEYRDLVCRNLTISGTNNIVTPVIALLETNRIVLNSSVTGTPTFDAFYSVNRGSSGTASVQWVEGSDEWKLGYDGAMRTIGSYATQEVANVWPQIKTFDASAQTAVSNLWPWVVAITPAEIALWNNGLAWSTGQTVVAITDLWPWMAGLSNLLTFPKQNSATNSDYATTVTGQQSNDLYSATTRTSFWDTAYAWVLGNTNNVTLSTNKVWDIVGNTNNYQKAWTWVDLYSNSVAYIFSRSNDWNSAWDWVTGNSNRVANSITNYNTGTVHLADLHIESTNRVIENHSVVTHQELEDSIAGFISSIDFGTTNAHPVFGVSTTLAFEVTCPASWTQTFALGTAYTLVGSRTKTNALVNGSVIPLNTKFTHHVNAGVSSIAGGSSYYYTRLVYVNSSGTTTNEIDAGSVIEISTANTTNELASEIGTVSQITIPATDTWWLRAERYAKRPAGAPVNLYICGGTGTPTRLESPASIVGAGTFVSGVVNNNNPAGVASISGGVITIGTNVPASSTDTSQLTNMVNSLQTSNVTTYSYYPALSNLNGNGNSLTNWGSITSTGSCAFATTGGSVGIGTVKTNTNLGIGNATGATLRLESSKTVIVAGDILGRLQFYNNDSSTYAEKIGAFINAESENYTGPDHSFGIVFGTSRYRPGSPSPATEAMRITSQGNVGIGTNTPAATLDVNGSVLIRTNLTVIGNLSVTGTVGTASTPLTITGSSVTISNLVNSSNFVTATQLSTATNSAIIDATNQVAQVGYLLPASTQGLFKATSWSQGLTNSFSSTGVTAYVSFKTNFVESETDPIFGVISNAVLTNAIISGGSSSSFVRTNRIGYFTIQTNTPAITNVVTTGGGTSIINATTPTLATLKSVKSSDNTIIITDNTTNLNLSANFDGTASPDYSVSYLGYPKINLTTNMLTSSSDGGTLVTLNSFTNAFDTSFISVTTTGAINAQNHAYMIDLTNHYSGIVHYSVVMKSAGVLRMVFGYSGDDSGLSGGIHIAGTHTSPGQMPDIYQSTSITRTQRVTKAFSGSRISINVSAGSAASTYWIRDWTIYGVTNGFNAYTGIP